VRNDDGAVHRGAVIPTACVPTIGARRWLGEYVLSVEIVLFAIVMGLSRFFSSSETRLFSLNRLRLEPMRRDDNLRLDLIERSGACPSVAFEDVRATIERVGWRTTITHRCSTGSSAMEMVQKNDELVRELSLPLFQSKGWMKLVGVMMIVYGILVALTIVGIVVAWLPVWIGVLLFQGATAVEQAQASGEPEAMLRSMAKLKVYFTIMGILTLIGIILLIAGVLLGTFGFLTGLDEMQSMQMQGQM
jgi:hypothetical protein